MQLTVHDVGHGLCISLVHENGNVMVWDAGHTNENRPSEFLQTMGIRKIDYFFVTNYDQDHISDLPNLRANIRLRSLYRNVSISAEQLIRLKLQTGPITLAMASMIEMIESYTGGPLSPAPEFPRVSFRLFSNSFNSERPLNADSLISSSSTVITVFVRIIAAP